ncbi:MAG: hypothetical protein U0W24_10885 [Bacteroidales bacterium]
MKKIFMVIVGMFLFLTSIDLQAQTKTGFEYFKGKWNLVVNAPNGDTKIVVCFEQKDGKVVGKITDAEGKELYQVTNIEIKDKTANITFIGSQSSDVPLELNIKDDDHVTGSIMNMFNADGERIKEIN